ncbi:MAG: 4-hydroxybutyrate--acetyl-CoA CoA transferase [Proteobacteria bacterium]|nr:4-hydroxybutyrate--acetyl-CoA CoA transferase [Pseudomonadota bacterium]
MAKSSITFSELAEAFQSTINSNSTIVTGMATAEPNGFFNDFSKSVLANNWKDLRVIGANPSRTWPCFTDPATLKEVEYVVMFLTSAVRKLQTNGRFSYIPQHLSQWAKNIINSPKGIDVYWGTCSEPDARGFVTLGLNNCYESEVLRAAKKVVLEVNKYVPRTFGATEVSLSEVDFFIRNDRPIAAIEPVQFGLTEAKIAAFVEGFISDGSTLQLGIGGIPNAVGAALIHKKDLGIHTEMINDAMMKLYQAGVITGACKTLWPRKMVGAFAYGSQTLYDFIHDNSLVEFHPASVVNNPYRIGRNHKMVSLNTAVEIDLTGQVCSESIGHVELSGVGGAAETHMGAQMSVGGRAIVAIESSAKQGTISKIVTSLKPGAKVSISRNDIDTVITEFGVAELKGKTTAQRVRSMIAIAHPDQRDLLTHDAKQIGYL